MFVLSSSVNVFGQASVNSKKIDTEYFMKDQTSDNRQALKEVIYNATATVSRSTQHHYELRESGEMVNNSNNNNEEKYLLKLEVEKTRLILERINKSTEPNIKSADEVARTILPQTCLTKNNSNYSSSSSLRHEEEQAVHSPAVKIDAVKGQGQNDQLEKVRENVISSYNNSSNKPHLSETNLKLHNIHQSPTHTLVSNSSRRRSLTGRRTSFESVHSRISDKSAFLQQFLGCRRLSQRSQTSILTTRRRTYKKILPNHDTRCSNVRAGFKPLLKFKQAAKSVIIILKALGKPHGAKDWSDAKWLSFSQYQSEITTTTTSIAKLHGLTFDPSIYKANTEIKLNNEARMVLRMPPIKRTQDQIKNALSAMNSTVDAFGEFPIKMQHSLVSAGWYERFENKRVIIRQGHRADNFYFIISGTAVVTILETDKKTNESFMSTVAFLQSGNSFGELALMHGAKRSATVTCKGDVELLAVGRDDFVDIFMHTEKNSEPEHIQFLRTVELLNNWPKEVLPYNDPRICLFTYFRRDVVICQDSNHSDWIYIVKSGTCRVLKSLQATEPNIPGVHKEHYLPIIKPTKSTMMISNVNNRTDYPMKKCLYRIKPHHRDRGMTYPMDGTHDSDVYKKSMCAFPPVRPPLERNHLSLLDEIYKKKHSPKSQIGDILTDANNTKEDTGMNNVFVEIQKLESKDTFGLVNIAFAFTCGSTSVSLVSDGAECILINKKFFMQHMSSEMQKILRTTIQPYPSKGSLQEKLQSQTNWDSYKTMLINRHILRRRYEDSMFY